ncbi:hypothetical protein [Hasllibacter sp. MH4015]|uniref:hypothetical protein n=1 Tax=Hasllibacter sp. MH4015 TaxID=2854029 RepID=UPI001CD705CA|nr:hypothetical protein [Hasllibacter sp. MH4015]
MNVTPLHARDSDPVRALADALSRDGTLKLWSVLVTCLGDISQDGARDVSGLALSRLVERIGLQPQAMRVALHRLKRDGWTLSRRDGRVGYHRLSESALAQTRAVADRIYGRANTGAPWLLVGLPPDAPDALTLLPREMSAVPISRNFALVSGDLADVPGEWLRADPASGALPDWVRDIVQDAACDREFAELDAALRAIGPLPDGAEDRFALRVLVLHGWRRLILRSNPAAEAALGDMRAEISCRATFLDLMDALGPPDISAVEARP